MLFFASVTRPYDIFRERIQTMKPRRPTHWLMIGIAAVLQVVLPGVKAQTEVRFQLAPSGNEARYRVREQFVGVNLPNDAVGATTAVTGTLVIAGGAVVPDLSKFTVDLRTLRSDSENRDRAVQGRVLQTEKFPLIELMIREIRGLTWPLPATGKLAFELVGDMRLHGETKPSIWQVTAEPKDGGLAGRASTAFTFGEFGMPVPTSFRVLSVEDNVRLEYDFHLVPAR
jgi:polyisoprenoid-binding protein YceI